MDEKNAGKAPVKLEHWKKIAIIIGIYDMIAVSVSYFLALLLRFDFRYSMIDVEYLEAWKHFAPVYAVACLLVFVFCGLYKSIWRFAGFNEFVRTLVVSLFMSALHVAATLLFYCRMPISYYMIGAVLPTAASASLPAKCPRMIPSAALKSCCTVPVAASGNAKSKIFLISDPWSMSIWFAIVCFGPSCRPISV